MTDYNAGRRWIKSRRGNLVGHLPGRAESICGVFVHATRSGRKNNDDGPGTENWGNHAGNPGGFQDLIIGGTGQQVQCCRWDLNEQPLWAAGFGDAGTWNAQQFYIHVEVSQGTIDSPFTEESIESLAQFVAEQSRIYRFAIKRIPFLSQVGDPPEGICDHQNSANGRKLGKSDPGPLFPWDRFIARARELAEEDGMTPEEKVAFEELRAQVNRIDNDGVILYKDGGGYDVLASVKSLNEVMKKHLEEHAKEKEFTG